MSNSCAIGIDLGGTRIKAGLVGASGTVLQRRTVPTDAARGPDAVLGSISQLVRDLASHAGSRTIVGVGAGSPGAIRRSDGAVIAPPNLPGWDEVTLGAQLAEQTGYPVKIENDANAAALGEFAARRDRSVRHLVLITIGTGVGGGIIHDERLLVGEFGSAGEIGHMLVVPGGRRCGCGQFGCLEAYASASSIAAQMREQLDNGAESLCSDKLASGKPLTSEDVALAARRGDVTAMNIWDHSCQLIGATIVNLRHLLNPQLVLIGGGAAAAGDFLLEPIRRHAKELAWQVADAPQIELATLGDDAGFVGAASMWLR